MGKPECSTLFRAISHMSATLSFHTCCAMEYSSTSGSLVRWISSGSSDEIETFRPRSKKSGKGFLW